MGLFDFLKKNELKEIQQLKSQLSLYKPILDIEAETEKQKNSLDVIITTKISEIKTVEDNFTKLKSDYQIALETYTKIRKEISLFENKLDLIEYGVYEPIYEFEKSDE